MRKRCSNCGSTHDACPECGSYKYSINEGLKDPSFEHFAKEAEDAESQHFKDVCWECGYSREYSLTLVIHED